MKRSLFILFSLLPLLAAAQKSFTISGKLPAGKAPVKAYLILAKNGDWKVADSADIKSGIFSITGNVEDPQQAVISIRYKGEETVKQTKLNDILKFYLESGTIHMASEDLIRNARITGSIVNQEARELSEAKKDYEPTNIRLGTELVLSAKNNPRSTEEEWFKIKLDTLSRLRAALGKINNEFISTHPNSFIALSTFYDNAIKNGKFNADTAQITFSKFSSEIRSTALGRQIAERIEKARKGQPGTLALDFTQPDINGKPFTLSSLRGKYVLVDFWASWCSGCREETPHIAKAYKMLKDKGLEVVSVSMDNSRIAWEAAMKMDGMPWINVSDLKGGKNEVAVMYGITQIPRNILIDPQGMIIAIDLRGESVPDKIAGLMK